MRVLVTGGAGFIGSHTVDALLERGHHVRVLDELVPPVHAGHGRPDYLPDDAELHLGSVEDRGAFLRALRGVDAVVHLAAYQDYLTDFSRFFIINCAGTALLYELIVAERLPIEKVVVASSQAIYGEGKYYCHEDGVVYPDQRPARQLADGDWDVYCPRCGRPVDPLWTDESACNPHSSYAISKRCQEELALALGRRYQVPTVALRYSIVQGPRQSFRNAYSGALRSFAVRVLTGQPPIVYEDGQQLRDFVSVHDVVRANLLALEDGGTDYQAFNVGGGRQITVRELADMVIGEAGLDVEPELPGIFRLGDTRHIFSDISRFASYGWRPVVGQAEIVREYLDWAAGQPDLADTVAPAQSKMREMGVLQTARVEAAPPA